MGRRLGIFFVILFVACRAMAIDATVAHNIFFPVNNARGGQPTPNIELYWQINPHTLHFTTKDKKILANIRTDIFISNDTGIIAQDHFIAQTSPRTDPEDLATLSILELRHYYITNGLIKIRMRLTDIADTMNRFVYNDSFTVAQPANALYFSGLQLIDTFISSKVNSPYLKNGRQQLPLCANFLDEHKTVLHYYGEVYGLTDIPASDFPLTRKVIISKKENEPAMNNFINTDTITNKQASSFSGSFPIATIGSGNYYLNATIENSGHKVIASSSRFFQRMNMHPAVEEVTKKEVVADTAMESVTYFNLDKTFLAKFEMPQIRSILKMLLPTSDPMAASTINNFLKKPDEMYMRYFIYNHFLAINKKDPARAWKEFSEKIIEVNKLFNFQGTPGYTTERGYIYLRYGAPTDIIKVNGETGTLPYEIWQYNELTQLNRKKVANAYFLFYKADQMLGDYKLLHSTVSGEVINMSWRTYLYTSSNTGVNTTTRAEEYIGSK